MITDVKIENFKSIRNQSFRDLPPIVGIWGENGTGKSSILQAIIWVTKNQGAFGGHGLNLGSPNEIVFGHEPGRTCTVSVTTDSNEKFTSSAEIGKSYPGSNISLTNLHYYPPWRSIMSRESALTSRIESDLGHQASKTHTFLHWFLYELIGKDIRGDKEARKVYERVNYWSEKIGFGQLLDIIQPNNNVRGTYKDSVLGFEIPFIDGGFGGNSFLPILLECYNEKCGIFLIEEPEISLHPLAQGHIWEFFNEMVETRGHQILFTSHSPYLASKIGRSLSQDKSRGMVRVYYVKKLKNKGTQFDIIPEKQMIERFHKFYWDIFPEMEGR